MGLSLASSRCYSIGPTIHRSQLLTQQALAHTLMPRGKAPCPQLSNNSLSPVAAAALRVDGRNLHIQCRVSKAARTGRSASPLAVARARDSQQSAHSCNRKLVAVRVHPGVLHRDPLAKYAAAFFNTSTSSFVSANSRRSRAFSASSSVGARLAGVPARSPACSFPARLRRIQFQMLESGISSRLAASLPPIDSASRTASILYSSVYRRFGTFSFLPICSSVHQKNTKILMYVKPGQGQWNDKRRRDLRSVPERRRWHGV